MRILHGLFIIIIFGLSWGSHAQDWIVWLYHEDDGLLLHLNSSGDVLDTRIVPTDDGYNIPHKVVFSNDQSWMATVAMAESSFRQRLTLYRVETEDVIFIYDLPPIEDTPFNADDRLILPDNAFSPSDQHLLFVTFIAGVGWEILIADTISGQITYTLPYNHPQVQQQPYLSSATIPQLVGLKGNILNFYIENNNGNPSPQGHSYVWFLLTDEVRETIAFPNAHHDVLDSGEAVYPLPNIRFPSENDTLSVARPHHNVLYVYQSEDDIRFPSIARPELDLLQAWFIQGGERVLIEAWEDEIRTRWLVYDRTGNEIRNLPQAGYDVTATGDGFLYLTELNDKSVLVHVNSRTFETGGDTVWVDNGDWQILSVTQSLSGDLLPFAQLDEGETPPPHNMDSSLQPTVFPTPLPLVYIGREMQLQVTDDGYINLRDEPSTSGEVQALLENGLYVDIIDGPVESGIYTWWKVRLSGREGWLVEEVEGTQILIPRRLAPIEDSDLEPDED